jgi:lysophospholipase L1-like esterase
VIVMKQLPVVAIALLLVLASAPTAAASSSSSAAHEMRYDVSVGDSLAAGVQPTGDPGALYRTDEGYAEQLRDLAGSRWPKLSLEKLGCPGETTETLIHGGICSYPHGSQLDEAVAFLRAHRDKLAFVTIDIGANDFPCQEARCIPAGVSSIQTNLPTILTDLRAAAGPNVPIIGMSIYNPFLASWLLGPDGQAFAQASQSQLLGPVDGLLRSLYQAAGDPAADVEGAFSSNDFATIVDLPGVGSVPVNVARICEWTWVCAPPPLGPNNHPNATGYGVIAHAFADVLGL